MPVVCLEISVVLQNLHTLRARHTTLSMDTMVLVGPRPGQDPRTVVTLYFYIGGVGEAILLGAVGT